MINIRHLRFLLIWLILLLGIGYGVSQELQLKLNHAIQLYQEEKLTESAALLEDIADDCLNANDTIKSRFLDGITTVYEELGRQVECIPYYLQSISLLQQHWVSEERYIHLFYKLGETFEKKEDKENAEKYYRRGLLKGRTLLSAPEDLQYITELQLREFCSLGYRRLAYLYAVDGDTALAKECFKQKEEDLFEKETEEKILDWFAQAMALREAEQYEEAISVLDEIDFYVRQIDTINEVYLAILHSKSVILDVNLSQFEKAAPIYRRAIDLAKAMPYIVDNMAKYYFGYIFCESSLGNFDKVKAVLSEARSYCKQLQGGMELMLTAVLHAGNEAYLRKRYIEVIPYYEMYLSNQQEYGSQFYEVTNKLSVCYIEQGCPSKAKASLMQILQHEASLFEDKNKSLLSVIYHNLGRACMLLDEYEDAIIFLQQSIGVQKEIYAEPVAKTLEYLKECQGKSY